jgi:hypothetical protein
MDVKYLSILEILALVPEKLICPGEQSGSEFEVMRLIICPGVHDPILTSEFLKALEMAGDRSLSPFNPLVVPTGNVPAYSAPHILGFLHDRLTPELGNQQYSVPLMFIGFSAGVVGAIATAHLWQAAGGTIAGLIALDGWGVPLLGDFPIYRLSHDSFTHWSSALLGAGGDSFYAEPTVTHLDLWRSPHRATGWCVFSSQGRSPVHTTAAHFITDRLQRLSQWNGSGN